MGHFEIEKSTLNTQYIYKTDEIIVDGTFVKNASTGAIQTIGGNVWMADDEGGQGENVGNFSGWFRNGEMRYSLSEMTRHDSSMVWDAITQIEQNILGENENQE